MDNDNSMTLRRNSMQQDLRRRGIQVADADELRFAPYVERTGTYDVRGTVINPQTTEEFTWTSLQLRGLLLRYRRRCGNGGRCTARISGGTKIEEKDLTYTTRPQPVTFEFETWGKYDVVGFMADKYFAGYNNDDRVHR